MGHSWNIQYAAYSMQHTVFLSLLTVLTYGPNNQLRGFRESIFIAEMLNRTIVVPPFFKHDRTDKTIQDNGNLVNPWDRIDFESLSKISSLAPNLYFTLKSSLQSALYRAR